MNLSKYFYDRGRTKRSGYWCAMAIIAPIFLLSDRVEWYLNDGYDWQFLYDWQSSYDRVPEALAVLLTLLFIFFFFILVERRCNDVGVKGWYTLVFILPLAFQYTDIISLIVLGCLKSDAAKDPRVKAKIKKLIDFFKK